MTLESAIPLTLTYLNLPPLPAELELTIQEFAKQIPPDEPGRTWIEDFHNNQIKAVSHVYGRGNTFFPDIIQHQLNQLYSSYFNESVTGIVGKLDNTQHYASACSPPHCDRGRYVAINYLLQAGGSNVKTCFYKQQRGSDDLTCAANLQINNLDFDTEFCVPEQRWHAYNVQYYHSVENIETTRLMLSLVLKSNPTVSVFKQKYFNLFINPCLNG